MAKKELGAKTFLLPMPTVLVGTNIDSRPNFMTFAYCGIVGYKPALIAISPGKNSYTNYGIKKTNTFSVNIPSVELLAKTDYCGLVSGRNVDKSSLFNIFYGKLENVPMIEECPVNLECKLIKVVEYGEIDDVFIGEIIEVYASEECLNNGIPDMKKVNPILFSVCDNTYWDVGRFIGKAFDVGLKLEE